ncbi:Serum response factor-binding protein 1, partial [Dictyocoela muelleri]
EEPLIEEPLIEEPLIEEPLIEEPLIEEPLIDKCEVKQDKVVEDSKFDISHENLIIDKPVVENIFMKKELSSNENKISVNEKEITDHEDEILCNKNEIFFNEIDVQKNEITDHENQIFDQKNQNIDNLDKIDENIEQAEIDENARKQKVIEKFLREIFGDDEKIENYKIEDKYHVIVENDQKIYDHDIVDNDHKNHEVVNLKTRTSKTTLTNSTNVVINLERRIVRFESGIEFIRSKENYKTKNDESRMKLYSEMNNYPYFKNYIQDNRFNTKNDLIVKSGYFLINNDESTTKSFNSNTGNDTFKSGNGLSMTLNDDHWRRTDILNKNNGNN